MAMTNDAIGAYRLLGVTLTSYLDGQADFAELEARLAETIHSRPGEQDLLKQLYHIANHYELDADLRTEDPQYASVMSRKLREIAKSLGSGSAANVERSLEAFWGR